MAICKRASTNYKDYTGKVLPSGIKIIGMTEYEKRYHYKYGDVVRPIVRYRCICNREFEGEYLKNRKVCPHCQKY